ncbi:MAG: 30S ribosomal protein S12 methylthiotransferase RimO [Saprospirales bacterium]|nr:MAG: 30S ribosomal protein S12 methylthiotransferase RimO [Saprospirales bacterium]
MKTKELKSGKVNVITLGCSKNLVDSENLISQLQANQIEAAHEENDSNAGTIVVNTCGFIDLAKEESVNTILEYAQQKKLGRIEKLYVTGCLSERYMDDLQKEMPEVDGFFGTLDLPLLLSRFNADYKHDLIGERTITTPPHYAYLKISEGCNRTCSFCAIPLMRGKHVSKPIEELVTEARGLARRGVKELMLIAQELTYYGLDLYKKRMLAELLDRLADVEGIDWIRLHYAYPNKFPVEVFDVMKNRDSICNYLDIPLQHASDRVLKLMKRQTSRQEMWSLIEKARQAVPGLTLRTTMIVGFPGETEEDFESLCDFVREARFDRMGVFQYSHEEDTSAHILPDDVSPELKQERAERLMAIQREISLEKNEAKVGKVFKVLFDRKEGRCFAGRTEGDSPEVDNEVLVDGAEQFVRIGDFANVKITEASEYDLYGNVID